MSAFGGFCYWDGRPVPGDRLTELGTQLHLAGPHAGGTLQPHPWLALQAHLLHFDRLSAQERQPFEFGSGSVLTWDGRLDNRDDLRLTLHRQLRGDETDAALVAAAYEQWGMDALFRLIGDWSLAIWDAAQQCVVLARDYMGNRPLYYRAARESLTWATRLEALAAAECLFGEPDDVFLASYVMSEELFDRTPFSGILRLIPGHVLISRREGTTVRRYWKYAPAILRYPRMEQYSDHFRALLTEAVRVRLRATRPVWAHLSGGWDSSSVVCLANRLIAQRDVETPALRPISIVYPDPEAEPERQFIAAVEQWCGISTTLSPKQGPPSLAERLGHRVFVPSDHIHRLDRHVQVAGDHVVLTGRVGDLIALSVSPWAASWEAFGEGRLLAYLRTIVSWAQTEKIAFSTLLFRLLRNNYHARTRPSTAVRSETYTASPYLVEKVRSLSRVPRPSSADFPRTARPLVDLLYGKGDEGSMAVDELCAPVSQTHVYSHRPFVEFLLAVPRSATFDPGFPRAAMGRALQGVLPPSILERRSKVGVPILPQRRLNLRVLDAMKNMPPLTDAPTDWRLVQRGIIEAILPTRIVSKLPTNYRQFDFLNRCVTVEAWLRTLAMPQDAVTHRAATPSVRTDAASTESLEPGRIISRSAMESLPG